MTRNHYNVNIFHSETNEIGNTRVVLLTLVISDS